MSEMMKNFLKAYLQYADAMANGDEVAFDFYPECGLCSNAEHYEAMSDEEYDPVGMAEELLEELHEMFDDAGMNTDYPFGEAGYNERYQNESQWSCPVRYDWIVNTLAAEGISND